VCKYVWTWERHVADSPTVLSEFPTWQLALLIARLKSSWVPESARRPDRQAERQLQSVGFKGLLEQRFPWKCDTCVASQGIRRHSWGFINTFKRYLLVRILIDIQKNLAITIASCCSFPSGFRSKIIFACEYICSMRVACLNRKSVHWPAELDMAKQVERV
jgi:hypothetical protein